MKKKIAIYGSVLIVCIIVVLLCLASFLPKGNTLERREALLNDALSRGKNWSIVKETEIDGYLISGATSADNSATIAVFEPVSNGNYRFLTSTNRDSDRIIIGGAPINGVWYDLIWFNGAQTAYAEVIYTVNGIEREPLRYDTANMDIISIQNPEKEYSLQVYYYDSQGNRYE